MENQKYYFYDLHSHTKASGDAISSLEDYIEVSEKRGLTGFAVTDHDKTYSGKKEINGITIIPGSEVTLKDGSHLLVYYIKEALPKNKLTLEEAVRHIKKQGGYCSLAHPTNIIGGYFQSGGLFKFRRRKNRDVIKALNLVDCIETGNASESSRLRGLTLEVIKKAVSADRELASRKLIYTAGSDAHSPNSLGMGVIRTNEPLTKENFLRVISEGKMIVNTRFNFARWVLYNIEQVFVMMIKLTFIYNNRIASNILVDTFSCVYLNFKHLLMKRKKKEFFNFQKKYSVKKG